MKKFLFSILGAVAIALPASAYDAETLTIVSNNVAAQSAVVELVSIKCANQSSVGVHIAFSLDAAGTDNQTFVFGRSVDGSTNNIESLGAKRTVIAIAGTGNTKSVTYTNIPTYGASHLFLIYHTNACATAVRTNTIIKYSENPYSP